MPETHTVKGFAGLPLPKRYEDFKPHDDNFDTKLRILNRLRYYICFQRCCQDKDIYFLNGFLNIEILFLRRYNIKNAYIGGRAE